MLHRAARTLLSLSSRRRLRPGALVASLALLLLVTLLPSYAAPAHAEDPAPDPEPARVVFTPDYEGTPSIGGPFNYAVQSDRGVTWAKFRYQLHEYDDGERGAYVSGDWKQLTRVDDRHFILRFGAGDEGTLEYGKTYAFTGSIAYWDSEGVNSGTSDLFFPFVYTGKVDVSMKSLTTSFLPVRDGRKDSARLRVLVGERLSKLRITMHDASGLRVGSIRTGRQVGAVRTYEFRGKKNDRGAAEGIWTWRLRAEDPYGNAVTLEDTVRASTKYLGWFRTSMRLKPSTYLISRSVGRCSALRTKGQTELLLSQIRCKRAEQSHVVGLHGVYLPTSKSGKGYRNLRLTGLGRAENRGGYVVLAWRDKKGRVTNPTVTKGGHGKPPKELQPSTTSNGRRVVLKDRRGHYVLWTAGLTQGSRFRITRFQVEFDRWAWIQSVDGEPTLV